MKGERRCGEHAASSRTAATSPPSKRLGAAGLVLIAAVPLVGATILVAQQATLPDGRGRSEFQRVCSGCHPVEEAVKGPRRSREGWQQVVDDMIVRGAEGSDEELKLVVQYLTEHFGPSPGPR